MGDALLRRGTASLSCGVFVCVICARTTAVSRNLDGSVNIEWVRKYCLAMLHATETVQWGDDLVFKVGGKMFAVVVLVPAKVWLSFKCSPEEFAELTERPGIIPAPYAARYYWIALETQDALDFAELERLLRQSYSLVVEKLPKNVRAALNAPPSHRAKSRGKRRPRRKAR
ncbi:MAG: MmcQ/YjbR family DNA-binding protein [Candidatus Acidiferrales bacterium]